MKKFSIDYVTTNAGKFEEATHILAGWSLQQVSLDIEEVQGTRQAVVESKARRALSQLNRPLIVEDVSVCCRALGGLPGVYIKDFLIHLGPHGLAELVHKHTDHSAQVICTACYIQPGAVPILFEGILEGTIVKPRGTLAHGTYSWNSIFQPEGSTKTFGESTMKGVSQISARKQALEKLRLYLETHETKLIKAP